MIRLATIEDLLYIDEIGRQISVNFCNKNKIEDVLTNDYTKIYVYDENSNIKGFLHVEYHYEITDIINIAVDQKYQKQGIGRELLNYMINNTISKKIMLEVRESNKKAINFYLNNDFIEIHRRKNYYGNEDAIIMERSL